MEKTIDWNDEAARDDEAKRLKRDVCEHGGFLTMQKDELRERFGISRLTEGLSNKLTNTLYEHGMLVFPPPTGFDSFRVYDVESEIGKIAQAVASPFFGDVPETALVDAVDLYKRANAGKDRRADGVPWLSALDVFLQLVIGRPPEGWEDLEDDRQPYDLRNALAASLDLPADIAEGARIQ
jgi:hypothetical protein